MIKSRLENVINDKIVRFEPMEGGCIAKTQRVITVTGKSFVLKQGALANMFSCEANGLAELAKSNAIRTPKVIAVEDDFLLLEYIAKGHADFKFSEVFGRAIAQMHKLSADCFGFYEDNFIGSTPQLNLPHKEENNNWIEFYFNKRLFYQFKLAQKNGYVDERFAKLFFNLEKKLPSILDGSSEKPSLLHGDLWSGNFLVDDSNNPVLIDPSVYYGHREAELAMTRLFGGFDDSFYASYNKEFPLVEGFQFREGVYTLYHVLNHLNIFGLGYIAQSIALMKRYL
jgi:protein-ribulosamine 3-kinase